MANEVITKETLSRFKTNYDGKLDNKLSGKTSRFTGNPWEYQSSAKAGDTCVLPVRTEEVVFTPMERGSANYNGWQENFLPKTLRIEKVQGYSRLGSEATVITLKWAQDPEEIEYNYGSVVIDLTNSELFPYELMTYGRYPYYMRLEWDSNEDSPLDGLQFIGCDTEGAPGAYVYMDGQWVSHTQILSDMNSVENMDLSAVIKKGFQGYFSHAWEDTSMGSYTVEFNGYMPSVGDHVTVNGFWGGNIMMNYSGSGMSVQTWCGGRMYYADVQGTFKTTETANPEYDTLFDKSSKVEIYEWDMSTYQPGNLLYSLQYVLSQDYSEATFVVKDGSGNVLHTYYPFEYGDYQPLASLELARPFYITEVAQTADTITYDNKSEQWEVSGSTSAPMLISDLSLLIEERKPGQSGIWNGNAVIPNFVNNFSIDTSHNYATRDAVALTVVNQYSGLHFVWTGLFADYEAITNKQSDTIYICTDRGVYAGSNLIADFSLSASLDNLLTVLGPLVGGTFSKSWDDTNRCFTFSYTPNL